MSMYAYWLANTGLTVHKLTGLMTEGIGAEELYALQESQMKKIRVLDEKDVEKITQSRRHWDVQEHWGKLQGEGIGFVCVEEARYPQKLRRISATPYALYYIGRLPEETRKSVAIVGARTRSAYGSQITGKLARALAQNRMDIISGMAMGIDADAHSGALEENGDTYAVLGCGVDVCYPKRNRYLYEKMQDRGGILSEYPPGTPPLPGYFPDAGGWARQAADRDKRKAGDRGFRRPGFHAGPVGRCGSGTSDGPPAHGCDRNHHALLRHHGSDLQQRAGADADDGDHIGDDPDRISSGTAFS